MGRALEDQRHSSKEVIRVSHIDECTCGWVAWKYAKHCWKPILIHYKTLWSIRRANVYILGGYKGPAQNGNSLLITWTTILDDRRLARHKHP